MPSDQGLRAAALLIKRADQRHQYTQSLETLISRSMISLWRRGQRQDLDRFCKEEKVAYFFFYGDRIVSAKKIYPTFPKVA